MLSLALLLSLAVDGGTVTPFEGTLEPGVTYVLTGTVDVLRPPTLKLPHHHASRVEWVGDVAIPTGKVRLVFKVERVDIERMSERRWNSTFTCRVLSATLL